MGIACLSGYVFAPLPAEKSKRFLGVIGASVAKSGCCWVSAMLEGFSDWSDATPLSMFVPNPIGGEKPVGI